MGTKNEFMKLTIEEIAKIVGGSVDGDGTVSINAFAKIEEGKQGALSFLANSKYTSYIYDTKSSVVIVDKNFQPEEGKPINTNLIRVENPYKSFSQLLDFYNSKQFDKEGIIDTAMVHSSAKIADQVYIGNNSSVGSEVVLGKNVKIHHNVTIGDGVTVGENSVIYPGVVIYNHCEIGKKVTIHANTVIGSDGFGFGQNDNREGYFKVPQVGNVIIEDNVEIGSSTTIDRATLGSTIIRKGVKLDNLIQIAHNVEIGENTVIAAQCGIAGSVKIGKNCMFGGQVGISGHLTIGDGVMIAAQSGIISNIEAGKIIQGTPALEAKNFNKAYVVFRKLPEIIKRLKSLEKKSE